MSLPLFLLLFTQSEFFSGLMSLARRYDMNQAREQSSANYPVLFFMLDASDHVSGKTGLTPTVTLSKNGGAFAASAGAVSEIGNGWYQLAGNATDRSALGSLALHASATGADDCDIVLQIVDYDPLADVGGEVWGAAVRTLTAQSATVLVTGPVVVGGGISVVPGDDYFADDGRQMEWSSELWPDLTGATSVEFKWGAVKKACTSTVAGAGIEQTVRLELSHDETVFAKSTREVFEIEAVLEDEHVATLVQAFIMAKRPGE